MSKNLFILGTGTDVGKTYISALLVKNLLNLGLNAGYFKPVSSGNLRGEDGALIPLDVKFVRDFSGLKFSYEQMSAFNYENAYSPHLAAKFEGDEPKIEPILLKFSELAKECEFMVIEGAGGAVCPLFWGENKLIQTDIVKRTRAPALIVADAGLGGINAAVLTTHFLLSQGVKISGIVLNNFDAANPIHADNKIMIEQISGVRVLRAVCKGQGELNFSAPEIDEIFKI